MSDWFFRRGKRENIDWLSLDSWIDSSLAESWARIKGYWDAGSSFFARFRLHRLAPPPERSRLRRSHAGPRRHLRAVRPCPPRLHGIRRRTLPHRPLQRQVPRPLRATRSASAASCTTTPCRSRRCPIVVIKATLATEDRRFFEHFGVDFLGTFRALVENLRANDVVQGGSSLTQQLAKNLFLSSERSLERKVKEVFLAFLLEARFSKREILKLYLDRAYLGGGAFGVDAASQYLLRQVGARAEPRRGRHARRPLQGADQVRPQRQHAGRPRRANEVLHNLVEAGFMTAGAGARGAPASGKDRRDARDDEPRLVPRLGLRGGAAHRRRQEPVRADRAHHRRCPHAASGGRMPSSRSCSQKGRGLRINSGALVAMEPDGAVRAMVGGPDYGESQFNRATHAQAPARLLVQGLRLRHGARERLRPDTMVRDASRSCGNWHPQNFGGSHGGGGRMPSGWPWRNR